MLIPTRIRPASSRELGSARLGFVSSLDPVSPNSPSLATTCRISNRLPQRALNRERGAIHLLEVATTLPLVLMLVLAVVDIFNVLRARTALTTAAQASLRCLYPVQGECHAQDIETTDTPTFRWWRWTSAINANSPLLAVDPQVVSVQGRRLQATPEVEILGSISYEQGQQGYELVLSASANASFSYFLQSLPRVRLSDPSFLNASGPNPVVINHSYAIDGGSLLAAASSGALNITASTSAATVTLATDTSALTTGGDGGQTWTTGDFCSTTPVTGPGSYPRCLNGWDTTTGSPSRTDNLIPTVLLVEGVAGGSFTVPPAASPPVVRMLATIGGGPEIDLGGRVITTPGNVANFVPRGAGIAQIDTDLRAASNAEEEFKAHAHKLVIPIRNNGRAATVRLRFFVEQNDAIGSVTWRPTSIRLFGPALSSRTSPPLPCKNGEPLSPEQLSSDRCDVGVAIGGVAVYPTELKIDPSKPRSVQDLGCFSSIEEAYAAAGNTPGLVNLSSSQQCSSKTVTAGCPPAFSDSGTPLNVGVTGDLTKCTATICQAFTNGATCSHPDPGICECCRARLDAMRLCPPPTGEVAAANIAWSETWTSLPESYNVTFDALECDSTTEVPGSRASELETLGPFAKIRFSSPREIDKVIIPPSSPAAAKALSDPSSCANLTTQTQHLCSILPKEPFCHGPAAAPLAELAALVNSAVGKLPFPAQLLPLAATKVGQSPNPADPIQSESVLELVHTGTTAPDTCSKEPCIREALPTSPSEQSGRPDFSKLHLAESVATEALNAVFPRGATGTSETLHSVSLKADINSLGSTTTQASPRVRNYIFSGSIQVPLLLLFGQPVSVAYSESSVSEDGWLGD